MQIYIFSEICIYTLYLFLLYFWENEWFVVRLVETRVRKGELSSCLAVRGLFSSGLRGMLGAQAPFCKGRKRPSRQPRKRTIAGLRGERRATRKTHLTPSFDEFLRWPLKFAKFVNGTISILFLFERNRHGIVLRLP